jgi:ABC-type polysaccharide/polyol phosphate export permease
MQGETSFGESLAIQWRSICALLMREIMTRYGRHNIGFFWLFVEPSIFAIGVTITRVLLHEGNKLGIPIASFTFSGYCTILLWRNCGNHCSRCIYPNSALLYHRNVRVIDVLLSRIILEISGCAMSFVMLTPLLVFIGFIPAPHDVWLVVEGYLMNAWFAFSLAIWVCAFTETSELFERLWHPVTYLMLPISGFPIMVSWLPLKYQSLALKMPMVNGCEMLRDGFFGNMVRCQYSVPYLSCWCLGLMLVGLVMLKGVARNVEPV